MKKTIVLTLAIMVLSAVTLLAQKPEHQKRKGHEHSQMTAEKRAEKMAKELDLTNQQKTEVLALFKQQETKRCKKQEVAKQERKEAFQAERKAQDEELKKIIGEEKFQQLQQKRVERMEKMKEKQHKGKHNCNS